MILATMRQEIAKIRKGYKACPWWVRVIVVLGIAYLLSPIDLIPDFLPIIGQLDDVALVVGLGKLVKAYTK
jgi:uncharacterized membrane protein YkvA (DUF1232 family)